MSANILQQTEADALLALPKRAVTDREVQFPDLGKGLSLDLVSIDGREAFLLDIGRSYVKLTKSTYQTRARATIILARLDLDGAPHTNPDGTELGCPHLHLYREGYGDKWAFEVPTHAFTDIGDRRRALSDFMVYCAVDPIPFRFDLLS
ncbi:DUF6978 family protein [uncultured Enterovirga sp.]|uniref:DUF6978 family protein n=1 Tax=uncultured Enterovirga sp. TaxID=2026352 RepID=UPI0035CC62D0